MGTGQSFRKATLVLHRWIGLAAAVFLLLTGASGSLLVFETQIDQALNRGLTRIPPAQATLSLDDLKAALERAYPGKRVLGFELSTRDDVAYSAYLERIGSDGFYVAINQHTGQILGVWSENRVARQLHDFHTHFLMGKPGSALVAWSSVVLLLISISGLILWWRAKVFRINFQTSGPKFQYDLHSTVGAASSLILMLFAWTGIVVHWEDAARTWARQVSHSPAMPRPASVPRPGASPLGPTQLLALAQAAAAEAQPTTVELPDAPESPALVILKFPEDHTPAGRTRVFLDAYSGRVLALINSRQVPAAVSYTNRLNREIHTGDVWGWPTRILAAVFSSALPVLAFSGPLLWWQRRQRRRAG